MTSGYERDMMDQQITMGVMLCMSAWEKEPPGPEVPVEKVAKRAFRLARDNSFTWFTCSDDIRFRIGCGILLIHYEGTETARAVKNTVRVLKSLSAAMSGVPVNLGAAIHEDMETLPLLPWYKETADIVGDE